MSTSSPTVSPAVGRSTPASEVPLREDATVIGLVGLAHASSHFAHLLLPPLFPVFMKEFGLSYAELGFLMTVFFVVSGIGQASAGFVVDRLGARPVLLGSFALFVAACLVGANVSGYAGLMAVAVLAGLGNAPFHPVDFTILNQRVSAPRLGHAFSAHGLTGSLGWAAAPVFFALLNAVSNWRVAYLVAALMYAAILLVLLWQRDRLATHAVVRQADASAGSDLAFLKLPVVWWCFGFFLLSTMTLSVVQNYAVSIVRAVHQVGFEAATMTVTGYMLCSAAGMLAGGFVAARVPIYSDRVVAWSMGGGAALLALCATGVFGGVGTMVVLAATGFAVGIGGPSRDLMIRKATPKGATGRVYGMVYSGLDTGFAVSPLIFGVFMDRGWYAATLVGAALALLASVGAALGVGRRTRQSV